MKKIIKEFFQATSQYMGEFLLFGIVSILFFVFNEDLNISSWLIAGGLYLLFLIVMFIIAKIRVKNKNKNKMV